MGGSWTLSPELQERVVPLSHGEPRREGEFVLYWAHHALRAHDNPALDAAAEMALQIKRPLLVYQGLGGRHRYNSDRHHRFILEAARDFRAELEAVGLRLHFHLPENPVGPGPLRGLLERSAVIVTELYPVPPFRGWYAQHVARHPGLPWLQVDASCILPMTRSEKAPTRAFQFRRKYQDELFQRVERGWPLRDEWPCAFDGDPGFEPFDLASPLDDAIAACRIDHSIPAVADTVGGSAAGYRRWARYLDRGLDRYHALRNDAALPNGVSRLSAYLHYGCVSPFRVASDAAARGGEGAEKFLDELLVWRELSHHFCFHSERLESLDALPGWARESLQEQAAEPRAQTFDWETLARGVTGQPLWDLAQRSLLRRGELHNNLRMTWGKSFIPWTQQPSRALKLMIDLNHRYALDGNDPNSYGGLLWCLGQFDRAFPPGPVFGKVRQRSLKRHAERLDMNRYARVVAGVTGRESLRVVVVGSGLAGLTAARVLSDQGHEVIVVDKGRKPGGRMSSRLTGGTRFDYGAQYFTARDPRFLRHVVAWRERGLVEAWDGRIAVVNPDGVAEKKGETERYVAVPSMDAVCAEIAAELPDCRQSWRVERIVHDGGWVVESASGEALSADALVVTVPPPQTAELFVDVPLPALLNAVEMRPCWAVMAEPDRPLLQNYDASFVNKGPLWWLSGHASRPGRPGGEAWILHAGPDWSEEHLDDDPESVGEQLIEAARMLPIAGPFEVNSMAAHRWRYARAREPLNDGAIWDAERRLAFAGDWCHGSAVEGAFLSGAAAAGRVMALAVARRGRKDS